jgi:RHS repeat-associated protein
MLPATKEETFAPLCRRIQKPGPLGATNYLYDGPELTASVIDEMDGAGNMLARYTRSDLIDEPLAMLRGGTTAYYEADGLGSVTSLSGAAGTVANTYSYDSFGNLAASTGTITNPFQYTARDSDAETGLRYYRARYYDPATGQFVSEDPVGFVAGVNFYRYAANSPQDLVDPTGFAACCDPKKELSRIREMLGVARDYVKDLQAGRPYVAKHGQELAHTTCIMYRAPSGRPSKEPLGSATIKMYIDQEKEPCIYDCVLVHEEVHKKQCEDLGMKYAGLTVPQKEIPAFQKEIGCYLRMLRSLGGSSH